MTSKWRVLAFSIVSGVVAGLAVYHYILTSRIPSGSLSDFRQPKTQTGTADHTQPAQAIADKSPLRSATAAHLSSDWETCLPASRGNSPTLDLRISACTRILEQRDGESIKNRVLAYSNR